MLACRESRKIDQKHRHRSFESGSYACHHKQSASQVSVHGNGAEPKQRIHVRIIFPMHAQLVRTAFVSEILGCDERPASNKDRYQCARVGDEVFHGENETDALARAQLLGKAKNYFDCAQKLEQAFRLPGQKVIWLLTSDSSTLRKAAAEQFGAKLLTDTERKAVHPDCTSNNPRECQSVELAMVHAMGQLFTFSMADYHIVTRNSGFGRLGAWMSGHWDNIYELTNADSTCEPSQPTSAAASAATWAGV